MHCSDFVNCRTGLQLTKSFSEVLIKLHFAVRLIKNQGWATSDLGRRGAGAGFVLWDSARPHFSSIRLLAIRVMAGHILTPRAG